MSWDTEIDAITGALRQVPWKVWEVSSDNMEAPSFKNMGEVPERYPSGAFITLMAIAGLNDYRIRIRAEIGYWPAFWEHVIDNRVPSAPKELASILEPFYKKQLAQKDKVNRLHRFLDSSVADELWDIQAGQLREIAESLPDFWLKLGTAMKQKPHKKTIAFSAKTIASALIILGINSFNYKGIPIPADSRLADLTPLFKKKNKRGKFVLNARGERNVQAFWATVLERLQASEPRILMYHLDTFLWTYEGKEEQRLAWLVESQGIDRQLAEQIIDAFEAIKEIQPR